MERGSNWRPSSIAIRTPWSTWPRAWVRCNIQSNRDRGKVRRFFVRYQDRLLYGTDLTQDAGGDPGELRREAHATWLRDWRYLNTDQTFHVPELDAAVRGLSLPKSVVRKIYATNAERWFGNPWR